MAIIYECHIHDLELCPVIRTYMQSWLNSFCKYTTVVKYDVCNITTTIHFYLIFDSKYDEAHAVMKGIPSDIAHVMKIVKSH